MERKHFSLIIKLRVEDFNILACAISKNFVTSNQ